MRAQRSNPRKPGRKLPGHWQQGKFTKYAGGYPLFYVTHRDEVLCPSCATKEEREKPGSVVASDANWEDPQMYCDECSTKRIESAYAEDDA